MFFLYLKITKCEKYKKIYKKVAKTTQKNLQKVAKILAIHQYSSTKEGQK